MVLIPLDGIATECGSLMHCIQWFKPFELGSCSFYENCIDNWEQNLFAKDKDVLQIISGWFDFILGN